MITNIVPENYDSLPTKHWWKMKLMFEKYIPTENYCPKETFSFSSAEHWYIWWEFYRYVRSSFNIYPFIRHLENEIIDVDRRNIDISPKNSQWAWAMTMRQVEIILNDNSVVFRHLIIGDTGPAWFSIRWTDDKAAQRIMQLWGHS